RSGSQAQVRGREVLRHRQGRQERLPDRELVLRGHLQARPAGRRLDLHAGGLLRQGRGRQHDTQESLTGQEREAMTTHAMPMLPASGVRAAIARALDVLGRFPPPLLQLMFRLAVASVFLKAGLNKIASWELTVQLFADEYKVPLLSPDLAATMAVTFEIGCSMLLILARVSARLFAPAAHAEVARARRADAPAYRRVTQALAAIRDETLLTTPMRTLADYDRATRRARIVVTTADDERPGETFVVGPEAADAVAWTFEDGVARYTGIYRTRGGPRISAFAPVLDARGRTAAVLEVDYPVDFYFDRLRELDTTIALGSLAG